jgi:ferrous iron transport protein B
VRSTSPPPEPPLARGAALRRVAIAGNPNTGKTTLFNELTGSRAKVGNYPGVTVDRHVGELSLSGGRSVELVDVPGTYSLAARSLEEEIAIQAIAGLHPLERPDVVVAVVDATQLVRNLYLVLQLVELGAPVIVALNMTDRLEETGQSIDVAALSRELHLPVVSIVASRGSGVAELEREIERVLSDPRRAMPGALWVPDQPLLLADLANVERGIPSEWSAGSDARRRAFALWALLSVGEHDELRSVPPALRDVVQRRRRLAEASGRCIEEEIIRGRYDWLDARAPLFLRESQVARTLTDRIDRWLLHPAFGFVFFLAAMTVVFQALFSWANPVIGWIEASFAWLGTTLERVLPGSLLTDLLVNGIVAGVGSVVVFLPQILLLFLFIGLMEDTGYMARVAYLMDRIMKTLGLHGRAFVPMLSGYACAVPAILATRTMERRRDRLLTMMVVPLMTCSARLPVYGLLIAALVPAGRGRGFTQGLLLAGMYLFSTVVALVAAAVLGRTVLRGERQPLLLEMPPYRLPHWKSVLRLMWEKGAVFLREAGTVILVCTIAMWALLSFPRDAAAARAFEAQRQELRASLGGAELDDRLAELDREQKGADLRASFGGRMGHLIEPAIEPLGFDWKIGIGLIGAFAAREVFVSTMAVVYGLEGESESSEALRDRVREERWPDGSRVFTPLVCFSLMVFFALACQCMSTLAAVRRETASWGWPAFLFVYMTALAWLASFAVVQGGRLLGWS